MDPTTLQNIEDEIAKAVDTAANIGEVIAPQYTGFIVLGQAVAKALPDLYNDVKALLGTAAPTTDAQAALAAKIHALANPETI